MAKLRMKELTNVFAKSIQKDSKKFRKDPTPENQRLFIASLEARLGRLCDGVREKEQKKQAKKGKPEANTAA